MCELWGYNFNGFWFVFEFLLDGAEVAISRYVLQVVSVDGLFQAVRELIQLS